MNGFAITLELHVFHYPTFSTVWTIALAQEARCQLPEQHDHTLGGRDIDRSYFLCNTKADAEELVDGILTGLAHHEGAVTFRHSTTPKPRLYAVKIDAGNEENGDPRRGWIIFNRTGIQTMFIEEDEPGSQAALAEANPAVTLGTISVSPEYYEKVFLPF